MTKTFGKRFNAQRAARASLKNPKAVEGKDFTTYRTDNGGTPVWAWAAGIPGQSGNVLQATAAKPPNAKPAAKPARAKAAKPTSGKRAQVLADAQAGKLPSPPDFTAPSHARYRDRLAELIALVKAGDVRGLKTFEINPYSSSPQAMDRYRTLAVIALEAQRAGKRAA